MKKITKRLSLRREVLQHLDLRAAVGGSLPSKPPKCTVVSNTTVSGCTSCEVGFSG